MLKRQVPCNRNHETILANKIQGFLKVYSNAITRKLLYHELV